MWAQSIQASNTLGAMETFPSAKQSVGLLSSLNGIKVTLMFHLERQQHFLNHSGRIQHHWVGRGGSHGGCWEEFQLSFHILKAIKCLVGMDQTPWHHCQVSFSAPPFVMKMTSLQKWGEYLQLMNKEPRTSSCKGHFWGGCLKPGPF